MKKKFILPILTLLVISGFVIHGYITMSSVYTFVLEVAFSMLATYVVIHTAAMNYKNDKRDMERYTFLSITLTVFGRLVQTTAILALCVTFYIEKDGGVLFVKTLDDFIVMGITFEFMVDVAVWHIHHLGTVRPGHTYCTNYELGL